MGRFRYGTAYASGDFYKIRKNLQKETISFNDFNPTKKLHTLSGKIVLKSVCVASR